MVKSKSLGILALLLACAIGEGRAVRAEDAPANSSDHKDLTDLSLEELMNVTVSTASKKEQKATEATSVISVISRKDIEASGAITLYDLLKKVPGYFPTRQATWALITARALPSDSTDHILLLVDGHPQNSIIGQGFQQQDEIPVLDKVERVEIIRGPGSVLWGANAALGIINVITRDTIDKTKVTVEGQSGQALEYASLVGGFGDGKDVKGLYSLSVWGARGYKYEKDGQYAVAFPWGAGGSSKSTWFAEWPFSDKQREGFDLYGKVKYKDDTELYARVLKTSFNYVWDEWSTFNASVPHEMGNRRAYLGVRKKFTLSDSASIESNIYGDYNLQNRDILELYDSGDKKNSQDQTTEEFATGAEVLGTVNLSSANTLKVGVKYVRTVSGPNRDSRMDPTTNVPISTGTDTDNSNVPFNYNQPYFGVEPGTDNSFAVYAEDSHQFGPATLFGGGRFDWDDYREHGAQLLPRAGLIYRLSDALVGKYTFNTGYLKPAIYTKTLGIVVDKSRGGAFPLTRATDAESVMSHDLQFSYVREGTSASLTLFYMDLRNFISFDANDVPQGYRNFGDARSFGFELEAKQELRSFLLINGSFSFARGFVTSDTLPGGGITDTNGRTLNYPSVIANLGFDLHLLERHTLNVNGRMWTDMRYVKALDQLAASESGTVFGTLGPEFYLDLNYEIKDLLLKGLDFNVFAFNLLDNQDRVGMVANNGTYRPLGRTLGARLAYNF